MSKDKLEKTHTKEPKLTQEELYKQAQNAQRPAPLDPLTVKNLPPIGSIPLPPPPTEFSSTKSFGVRSGNLKQKIASLTSEKKDIIKTVKDEQLRHEFQNVRVKEQSQKLLDFFNKNHLTPFKKDVAAVLKQNKGYAQANATCKNDAEKKEFEQAHILFTQKIFKAMEKDAALFVKNEKTKGLDLTEKQFLIYSFLYHAYERCLELDHDKWSNEAFRKEVNSGADIAYYTPELKYLVLSQIALNYYQDFYNNVEAMKKFDCWKNVDVTIREKEVWSVSPCYLVHGKTLEDLKKTYKDYINTGKGVSIYSHNFIRLAQPNENFDDALGSEGEKTKEKLCHTEMENVFQKVISDMKIRF